MIAAPYRTMMGFGWRTNFDASAKYKLSGSLETPSQAANFDTLHFVLPDGFEYHFRLVSGVWKLTLPRFHATSDTIIYWDSYRTDYDASITVSANGVELRTPNETRYSFDNLGRLSQITMRNGLVQAIAYDGFFPIEIKDSLGRWLRFEYETDGNKQSLVRKALTSDSKTFEFDYIHPETGTTTSSPP